MQNYKRMYLPPPEVPATGDGSPLLTNSVYHHIQVTLWHSRYPVASHSLSHVTFNTHAD